MLCSSPITIFILILNFRRSLLAQKKTHYEEDFMGRADKLTIQTMAQELVIDAKLYHRQIMVIREQYNMFLGYEVGLVIGTIRETYKRMMEVYHEAITKKKRDFDILPPSVDDYKSLHFLVYMETIRSLEMEIDKLVHVLENIPKSMINNKNALPSMDKMMGSLANQSPPDGWEKGGPGTLSPEMAAMLPPGYSVPGFIPTPGPKGRMRAEDEDLKVVGSTAQTTHPPQTAEEVKQAFKDEYYSSRRNENWTLDDYYGFPG